MKLNKIAFEKDSIFYEVEENAGGSFSIDACRREEDGRYENIFHFRTDDCDLGSLIEALQFIKNYNFIQEE